MYKLFVLLLLLIALLSPVDARRPKPPKRTPTPTITIAPTPTAIAGAGITCSAAIHDQYVTTGPDNLTYPTWHPVQDVAGCVHRHEHGSDPARVPGAIPPAFGYGTPPHMHESHVGYKVKAVLTKTPGVSILVTNHVGTAHPEIAVCQRHHYANMQFVRDGRLVANLTFMADFGAATHNDTGTPLDHPCMDHETGQMVTQAQIAAQTYGERMNPVGPTPTFYYPWRMNGDGLQNSLGLHTAGYSVNTPTVLAFCTDMRCDVATPNPSNGIWGFINVVSGWGVQDDPARPAIFYTDWSGLHPRHASDAGAVQQYMADATSIRLTQTSDQHGYFADIRYGGLYGDWTYTETANGDTNRMGNTPDVVNPGGLVQGEN